VFKKILIANRGEIACRIMRTAKAYGVKTVAVFSDADADASHVQQADEAVNVGPPAVAESYLCGDKIVQAALDTGAEAIHPGYGFLSENPDFVEQVEAAGLCFIGPSATAIRAMGLKDAAKQLMEKAGVPVVPGYHGERQDSDFLARQAADVGYPVLIKARAGGGGKGMRRVDKPKDFNAALDSARREAEASFGDSACLIEKYIASPRHIEIQVFGDSHGNVVHLFERDCSLQRRHQKVIEEAPAPGMTAEMRRAMGDAAVKACQAISYSGAGTIEFIVDGSDGLKPDRFWFMEMNTRLQVEHPVTEAITGEDLVAWQLMVANGAALPKTQDQLTINGWAFESRIYAEDANNGFLPATGQLTHLQFPEDARVDTGVRQGDSISPFYDPMIAKVIVHAETREAALGKMQRALVDTHAGGSTTNINFLAALCSHRGFAQGKVDTGLIERDIEQLVDDPEPPGAVVALAAVGGAGLLTTMNALNGFALWDSLTQTIHIRPETGDTLAVRYSSYSNDSYNVGLGDQSFNIKQHDSSHGLFDVNGQRLQARVVRHGESSVSVFAERAWHFTLPDPLANQGAATENSDQVIAPMPGQVKVVNVAEGDNVAAGDVLLVLEAMKMEHALTAPQPCSVSMVGCQSGDQVDVGALLLSLAFDDPEET
jgi:3-methylcrotonyl-CoA carboxylase alpha subunit